ncbi:MAG TPA: hypothetical protein VEB66_08695 [Opitutaceae bacterium]|nr:hypothetical protein [Opitutaceae bacterium]
MNTGAKITLSAGLLVLVAAVAGVLGFRPPSATATARDEPAAFAELRGLGGDWTVEELPIGETELLREKVASALRYDHAVFLRFRRGEREFFVYLVHWLPGTVHPRAVRSHTPDVCWVNAGWQPLEQASELVLDFGPQRTPSCEYRRFRLRDHTQEVVFWHLLNGNLVPHWRGALPTPRQLWSALRGDWSAMRGEQYFVRISSPEPFRHLGDDAVFLRVLQILDGLARPTHAESG